MKPFNELIETNGGRPVEFAVNVADYTGRESDAGRMLEASCWTDDAEVMNWPATFDVNASWRKNGGLEAADNLHGELDGAVYALINLIERSVGGHWAYDAAECSIAQL